jgi:hypothetical protein
MRERFGNPIYTQLLGDMMRCSHTSSDDSGDNIRRDELTSTCLALRQADSGSPAPALDRLPAASSETRYLPTADRASFRPLLDSGPSLALDAFPGEFSD